MEEDSKLDAQGRPEEEQEEEFIVLPDRDHTNDNEVESANCTNIALTIHEGQASGSTTAPKSLKDVPLPARKSTPHFHACFYCDKSNKLPDYVYLPMKDDLRRSCFEQLAAGNWKVAQRLEDQYQKFPKQDTICLSHSINGSTVWLADAKVVDIWQQRLEEDAAGVMMSYEYANKTYNYKSVSLRRCFYCRKSSYHAVNVPNSACARDQNRWFRALSLGNHDVESILRSESIGYGTMRICSSHFLRSAFRPSRLQRGSTVLLRLRSGELPVGNHEINEKLLESLSIIKQKNGYLFHEHQEVDDSTQDEADDEFVPYPVEISTWPDIFRRYDYYLDIPYKPTGPAAIENVPAGVGQPDQSNQQVHRFGGRTHAKMFCIACKATADELHDAFIYNTKRFKKEVPDSVKKKGSRSPFTIWMSENKEWLRTQFTYKVHEFSSKARCVWNDLPEPERQLYFDRADAQRMSQEAERAADMAEIEKMAELRPAHHGMEPAWICVKEDMLHTNPDKLKHVCLLWNRPFTLDHFNEDGLYVPPLLPFLRYGGVSGEEVEKFLGTGKTRKSTKPKLTRKRRAPTTRSTPNLVMPMHMPQVPRRQPISIMKPITTIPINPYNYNPSPKMRAGRAGVVSGVRGRRYFDYDPGEKAAAKAEDKKIIKAEAVPSQKEVSESIQDLGHDYLETATEFDDDDDIIADSSPLGAPGTSSSFKATTTSFAEIARQFLSSARPMTYTGNKQGALVTRRLRPRRLIRPSGEIIEGLMEVTQVTPAAPIRKFGLMDLPSPVPYTQPIPTSLDEIFASESMGYDRKSPSLTTAGIIRGTGRCVTLKEQPLIMAPFTPRPKGRSRVYFDRAGEPEPEYINKVYDFRCAATQAFARGQRQCETTLMPPKREENEVATFPVNDDDDIMRDEHDDPTTSSAPPVID